MESHNITKLYDRDFHKISNNAYPVVFAYNGRDHFAPTIPCTAEQFTQWKVQSELGNLLAASLHVCAQLDQQQLPGQICSAVKEVQTAIARNPPTISQARQVQFKELQKSQISTHRGPAIQPPTPSESLTLKAICGQSTNLETQLSATGVLVVGNHTPPSLHSGST